jgi:DNA polymerase-3 subunit epsilon
MRQIVLDTETTGLSTGHGHRIIEIGCLELVNRRLTGREFHRFLNPERDIDEGAERVHGISREDLETEPRFGDIADEFLGFIKDAELVIHNADFDVGFLEHELGLIKHPKPTITEHAQVLDTLKIAREMHPGQRNSLDALCKRYEVDASKRDVHGALIDAELLARVYLAPPQRARPVPTWISWSSGHPMMRMQPTRHCWRNSGTRAIASGTASKVLIRLQNRAGNV